MEPTTFNIQFAIDTYISRINNQGSITNADAMELTAHLYDATAALQQNNLTEEEAFIIACKRLGTVKILTDEYSKVNPSLSTNKVWAFLLIGFNVLSCVPLLILYGISAIYYTFINSTLGENWQAVFFISFNLAFASLMWFIVRNKQAISVFVEKQANRNALRSTLLSFLPLILSYILRPALIKFDLNQFLFFPIRGHDNVFVELTFYIGAMSILFAVFSLVFSLRKPDQVSLKGLFEKPSYAFLITFGVLLEFLAATTRTLRTDVIIEAFCFGLIYLMGAFIISYYNKVSMKYIFWFAAFGFIVETSVGISNDLDRGSFYFTICFVSALIIGVVAGWLIGLRYSRTLNAAVLS